jgi:lysophospholipid acyltransferase 7
MLTTSPGILAEGLMEKGFKQRFLAPSQHKYYNFCTWFFRTRLFDYMSMGFILLSYDATIRFWRSVYFIGHASCVFFIIIGYVLVKTRPRDSKKDKKN